MVTAVEKNKVYVCFSILYLSKFLKKISGCTNQLGLRKVKNYKIYQTNKILCQSCQLQSLGLFHWSVKGGRLEEGRNKGGKIKSQGNFSLFQINFFLISLCFLISSVLFSCFILR